MAQKSPIDGLFEFRIADRLVYGLCTHERTHKGAPNMGQFIRFFAGVEQSRPKALPDILSRDVVFSVFMDLQGQIRLKNACHLMSPQEIPESLKAAPLLRCGGPPVDDRCFLVEGLGKEGMFVPVDDPYDEAALADAPTTEILSIEGLLWFYRYNLTSRRRFDIQMGRYTLDEDRDAVF